MTLSRYCVILCSGSILCWIAWAVVLIIIKPSDAGILGFTFFYLTLFCAVFGTASTIGIWIRSRLSQERIVSQVVGLSLQQGAILAVVVVAALELQHRDLLRWWNMVILILITTLLEGMIHYFQKENK